MEIINQCVKASIRLVKDSHKPYQFSTMFRHQYEFIILNSWHLFQPILLSLPLKIVVEILVGQQAAVSTHPTCGVQGCNSCCF